MAQSRISFASVDKIGISLALLLGLLVAAATFIFDRSGASGAFNLLFYPLMPGLIVHFLITGVHGGTATQEANASWIASIVNGSFYFWIVIIARLIWRKLISRPAVYKRIS
jgi:hypothetical protein